MYVNFDKIIFPKIEETATFSEYVVHEIFRLYPQKSYHQKKYYNFLFDKKNFDVNKRERFALIENPAIHFYLDCKMDFLEDTFEEKQNDTAGILVVDNGLYEIIDIKTRNLSKSAQVPNIISAYKLAQLCVIMIDNQKFDNLSINYFEIDWLLEDDLLVCKDTHYISLFKSDPESLYINWAAAMQIQFHVCDLEQDFTGEIEEWTKSYLKHFVAQAYRRSNYMIEKYAKPFEKYIEE